MNNCKSLLACLTVLLSGGMISADCVAGPPEKSATKIVYRPDAVYGRVHGAGLLADIAYPVSKRPLPAILSVHGGRWRGGHKRDRSAIDVKQWAGFGFFAMSIDYRLVGCTPAPACYQDLQCAIRFLHAHAREYNIDPRRIFLIGQSAGGHLVSLAATMGEGRLRRTGGWEKASNEFRAVISVAANYELTTLSWGKIWTPRQGDPVLARKAASPVNHVSKNSKPLLILHSDNDRSVPINNALLMVDALKKAGAPHQFRRYPKMGHMGINDEVIRRTREFIKEQSADVKTGGRQNQPPGLPQVAATPSAKPPPPPAQTQIRAILSAQAAAWNRGDIDAFMKPYWKSEKLTFSSSGTTTRGWASTRSNYQRRYPSREAMGKLTFDGLEVTPAGDSTALVLGRWQLERKTEPVSGNFSLLFRRIRGQWVIVHDHTSREAKTDVPAR